MQRHRALVLRMSRLQRSIEFITWLPGPLGQALTFLAFGA